MYVVVTYDADSEERENIRTIVKKQLHWVQHSVYAGELTRSATEDLFRKLKSSVREARVSFWVFDRPPDIRQIGTQKDRESIFL
ncbi:MAG: CRISPR-associated endonuclease Cas2 [Thermoplasmatales archaeon]